MATTTSAEKGTSVRKGGSWLIDEGTAGDVFTPEQLTNEHRLIARTALDFSLNEVLPQLDALEQKDWALSRTLVKRAAELGLLATDVAEAYGGLDLDKVSALVVAEGISRCASFGTTFGAMANLSVLPLSAFGTEDQKQRYLTRIVSGELIGAYALSESGSGSDALGAKTRATRQPDGSFTLTGEKMWITNAGFADVFIVFAKVDGEAFTAFIVERSFPGVSTGKEEHKLGLHGSSTAPLIMQDARVPAENVLGEIGKGHKVAFNVLNYGRFKLGAMCTGGGRGILAEAAKYAATRKQFGVPIATFGAIKYKLSEMTTRLYGIESALYRTAGLIDSFIEAQRAAEGAAFTPLTALEEFAIESSIAKVAGSEILDYVIDENLQIHGGNGYVHDYPAERHYRDARVNRIFEGTNEINRLLIAGMLMRRAVKGDLALIPAAKKLQDEVLSPSMELPPQDDSLDAALWQVRGFKKTGLLLLGSAMQKFGDKTSDEQEVLQWTSDVLMDAFMAESAVFRARRNERDTRASGALQGDTARLFVHDAGLRIEAAARQALAAIHDGDTLRTMLAALRRILKPQPINTVTLRRRIADAVVAKGGYPF